MNVSGKSLELLLYLATRHHDEFSGYQLGKTLGISSGTLYPLLVKLKQAGMLQDRWENEDPSKLGRPRRRYYKVTGLGVQVTEEKMQILDARYGQKTLTGGASKPVVG